MLGDILCDYAPPSRPVPRDAFSVGPKPPSLSVFQWAKKVDLAVSGNATCWGRGGELRSLDLRAFFGNGELRASRPEASAPIPTRCFAKPMRVDDYHVSH